MVAVATHPLANVNEIAEKQQDGRSSVPWWLRSTPPPLDWRLAGVFASMLAPACAGAAWGWSPIATAATLLPGYVAYSVLSLHAGRDIDRRAYQEAGLRRLIVGGLTGLALYTTLTVSPRAWAPAMFVIDLVVVDLAWRVMFRRSPQPALKHHPESKCLSRCGETQPLANNEPHGASLGVAPPRSR